MATIYLCREHTQVGDELIHKATLDSTKAHDWARGKNRRSGSRNFDVVKCEDNVKRADL